MKLTHPKKFLTVLPLTYFLFISLGQVNAYNTDKEICAATSKWAKANIVKFEINVPKAKKIDNYLFKFTNNKEARIDVSSEVEGRDYSVSILLISGAAMLTKTKGHKIDKRHWIDYLDRPVLMFQVVYSLLEQAFLNGPLATSSMNNVVIKGKNHGIKGSGKRLIRHLRLKTIFQSKAGIFFGLNVDTTIQRTNLPLLVM